MTQRITLFWRRSADKKGEGMTDILNLIETIAKNDTFSTFSRLMGTSHANEAFSGGGDFTVFAPTNDAFGKISDKRMNELLNEKDQASLKALLSYHILPGKFFAANIASSHSKPTITGTEVKFTDFGGLKVNDSGVQARNIEASNGVVHALDTVLDYDTKTFETGRLSPIVVPEESAEPQPATLISQATEKGKKV
jgi:uncharacterized surface protein with fasciclin (FAS1) repeats